MRSIIQNKKGAITDLFLFMTYALVIIVFMVIMTFIGTTTYQKITEKSGAFQKALGNSGNATEIIDSSIGQVNVSYSTLKWISVMLIFGLAFSILITSFLVKTNPVFFVPYLIIIVIAVILSVPISNAYETMYNNPTLYDTFSGFFGASWIFLHLPIWVLVIGILSAILMFVNMQRNL